MSTDELIAELRLRAAEGFAMRVSEADVPKLLALLEAGEKCREVLGDICLHDDGCVLSRYEAGRPKPGGGYEQCFAGTWYEVRPNNNAPKCTCGLFNAMDDYDAAKEAK